MNTDFLIQPSTLNRHYAFLVPQGQFQSIGTRWPISPKLLHNLENG
jgi:hypothetical protein